MAVCVHHMIMKEYSLLPAIRTRATGLKKKKQVSLTAVCTRRSMAFAFPFVAGQGGKFAATPSTIISGRSPATGPGTDFGYFGGLIPVAAHGHANALQAVWPKDSASPGARSPLVVFLEATAIALLKFFCI